MKWMACSAFVVLTACTTASPPIVSTGANVSNEVALVDIGNPEKVAPDWIVRCVGGETNAVGKVPIPAHCRAEKYDRTAIAQVSAAGTKIVGGFQDRLCPSANGLAVDKRPIGALSLTKQIAAMRGGQIFAREYNGIWPNCRRRIEVTSLGGFSEAYEAMLRRWQAYK